MTQPTGHTTFKYKLRPTPEQAAQLTGILGVCRDLYNAALQERKEAWQQCCVSVNYYQQKAHLPEIRAYREDCAAIHSQVWQDVVLPRSQHGWPASPFALSPPAEKKGWPI